MKILRLTSPTDVTPAHFGGQCGPRVATRFYVHVGYQLLSGWVSADVSWTTDPLRSGREENPTESGNYSCCGQSEFGVRDACIAYCEEHHVYLPADLLINRFDAIEREPMGTFMSWRLYCAASNHHPRMRRMPLRYTIEDLKLQNLPPLVDFEAELKAAAEEQQAEWNAKQEQKREGWKARGFRPGQQGDLYDGTVKRNPSRNYPTAPPWTPGRRRNPGSNLPPVRRTEKSSEHAAELSRRMSLQELGAEW